MNAVAKVDHEIAVKLNGNNVTIEQQKYSLSDLKAALGVPQEYVLDEIVGNHIKDLPSDKPIEVHPGQQFVSHVPEGSSS